MACGTVYFVHPVKREVNDVSGALEYGDDAKWVNNDYVFPDQIDGEQMPADCVARMVQAAKQFQPTRDYLAIVGDQLQLMAFAGLLMQLHGTIRVLRWDRDARGYLPVVLTGLPRDETAERPTPSSYPSHPDCF